MQISQRLIIIQKPCLRHKVRHEVQRPYCLGFEPVKVFSKEAARRCGWIFDEQLFDAGCPVGWWHPAEGQIAIGFKMPAHLFELGAAFRVDQPGGRITPAVVRIRGRIPPVCFEPERPSGPEPHQQIIHPGRDGDQFFRRRAFKVGAAIGNRPLQAAILVEDNAGRDEGGPFQMVGKACRAGAVFTEVQHARYPLWRTCRISTSTNCGSRRAAKTQSPCAISQ